MSSKSEIDLISSHEDLLLAQEHLLRVKSLLAGNRYETYLYDSITTLEAELARQLRLTRPSKPSKSKKKENIEDSPSKRVNKVVEEAANQMVEKNKLYDVLELQTNGYFPPDTSYTSLTREAASSKYEELIQEGVSPDYIKVVKSRNKKYV